MKRLTSMILCSTLLLGLISNSRILNSYAEENQTITSSQSDKEAVATENQEEQKNESTTETTTEGTSISESDASEVPINPEEKNINDVPRTKNEPIEKSSDSSKKKAANSVLATTPDQATTEDEQVLDIAHTQFSVNMSDHSITLTAYTGDKINLVIPSKIQYQGMDLSVKISMAANNASALFPRNVHSIKFISVGGTKVKFENNVNGGVSLENLFAVKEHTYPNLTSIDFSGLDMDNVITMKGAFNGYFIPNLTTLSFGNNTLPSITDMSSAFFALKNLETLEQQWIFGKLTNMFQMFYMNPDETKLSTIGDTSQWNTSTVINMKSTFLNCLNLINLNLSNWDTSNVTDMANMFWNCQKLSSIGDTSNWNVSHVTNFSGMFFNCISLSEIRMDNWDLQSTTNIGDVDNIDSFDINNPPMFYLYSRSYDPLPALIVTSNKQLIDYPYAKAGYEPKCEIRINTNTGTLPEHLYWDREHDKNTDISYYFYQTAIPTNQYNELSKSTGQDLQNKVRKWLEDNVPTKTDYALTGWAPTDEDFEQKILSLTDFNTFMNSTEEFKAEWVSDKFDTSVDNTKLNPAGSLGLAYYPKTFTISSTDLQSSGEQKIPIFKQESLNLGIKDRTRTRDTWTVTAQLTWNGNRLPDAYITSDNSTVTENISTGSGTYSPSTDLKALSDNGITGTQNYQINSNTKPIMESNGTIVNNGVYDFNLGGAVLVIPDVSQVAAGHYQGQVNWNLIIGPS